MTGKDCCICKQHKAQSSVTIPYINVGKYRTFMVCKKQHLSNMKEMKNFSESIDQEVKDIQKNGDMNENSFTSSQEDETSK